MTIIITGFSTLVLIGGLLGLLLGVAGKFLAVEVDKRIEDITAMLPNYNCGGCGYAGCAGLAEALIIKEVNKVSLCKPSKEDARQKIVAYLSETPGPDGETIQVSI